MDVRQVAKRVRTTSFLFLLRRFLVTMFQRLLCFVIVLKDATLYFPTRRQRRVRLSVRVTPEINLGTLRGTLRNLRVTITIITRVVRYTNLSRTLRYPTIRFVTVRPLTRVMRTNMELVLPPLRRVLSRITTRVFSHVRTGASLATSVHHRTTIKGVRVQQRRLSTGTNALTKVFGSLVHIVRRANRRDHRRLAKVVTLRMNHLRYRVNVTNHVTLVRHV